MDDDQAIALAVKAAGLERTLAEYPDAVRKAYAQASRLRAAIGSPQSPAQEPWPPMTIRTTPDRSR